MDGFVSKHGNSFLIRPFQASAGSAKGAEESKYGADFVTVLTIDTREQQQCFGWIGQAKIADKNRWSDLMRQCRQMDKVLPGLGWAVLYDRNTTVVPAQEVARLTAVRHARVLRRTSWSLHFEEFLGGRVGDRRACGLLRTGFVEARQRQYSIQELLPTRFIVLDAYYGGKDREALWLEGAAERLAHAQPLRRRDER